MRRILVTIGALVMLAGCTSGDGTEPVAGDESTATTTTSSPRPTTSRSKPPTVSVPPVTVHTSTPRATPTGVRTVAPGGTLQFGRDGDIMFEVTVESAERYTDPRSDFSDDPPVNGQFLVVTLVARAMDSVLDPVYVSYFDFYLRDPSGNRWDATAGNGAYEDSDTRFPQTELNAGEQVRGTITFDVAAGANELVFAPESRAIGVWAIP